VAAEFPGEPRLSSALLVLHDVAPLGLGGDWEPAGSCPAWELCLGFGNGRDGKNGMDRRGGG